MEFLGYQLRLNPGNYRMDDPEDRETEPEERDYYTMDNVFWVPDAVRWTTIQAQAKQSDTGVRIDAALESIEDENPQLKGILDKRFGRSQLEPGRLGELNDLISTVGFGAGERAKDVLGAGRPGRCVRILFGPIRQR